MSKLAAALGLVLASAPLAWPQDVAEPQTGVRFAARREGETLLGVGLRVKKVAFVKAKICVVALYVGDAALAGPLAAHKGNTKAPEFFKDLVWGDFDKALTLHFVRNLGRDQIRNGMREALAGRADAKLLEQFVGYFPELKDGQECTVRWRRGGPLEVTMAGEARPPIGDKAFAAAVFGLYLGENPLQEDIKRGLVSRAAEALAGR
jgi:Chalcone isomerase-like